MGTPLPENNEFYKRAERAFRNLFDTARAKHELHFAMSLMPEIRGARDPGWNTAAETRRAFDEYLEFIQKQENGAMRCRVALAFYCHIAESSGFYEVPKNMLRVAGGQSHVLWPFMDLVQAHKQTGDRIAPNANKVLKDLAGHAKTLGFDELSEVFRDAFDPDIRNGYAHADYVVWDDGLRLPRRNGGLPKRVSWEEFEAIFQRGIKFFDILRELVSEYMQSYNPPKKIVARLQNEPEMEWTISWNPITGAFGIRS